MEKVYKKLDTLFLGDKNQSTFLAYETFKGYRRQPDTSIEAFLINFCKHIAKLKDFNILLPEPVLPFRALKSAKECRKWKVSQGYYQWVDTIFHVRTITEDYAQSSDASSSNTPPIMVKNEVDVIAYVENNQTDPRYIISILMVSEKK